MTNTFNKYMSQNNQSRMLKIITLVGEEEEKFISYLVGMNSKSMGRREGSEATERQGAHSDPLRSWPGGEMLRNGAQICYRNTDNNLKIRRTA